MWHMGAGWGWWMIFGWIWIIILGAIVVWGVLALARGFTRQPGPTSRIESSALDVLERRYASGELTDEEFERMRRVLRAMADATPNPEGDHRRQTREDVSGPVS